MKKWALILSAVVAFSGAAQATDEAYFQLREPEISEGETVVLNSRLFNGGAIGSSLCTEANPRFLSRAFAGGAEVGVGDFLNEMDTVSLVLDRVVNLGKKVWALIEEGKPVVNLKTDVATALPYGAKCWQDLQTWSAPIAKTYSVVFKNLYGMEVVKFSYRVIFVSGGSVNGKGAYIGYAAIEPADVYVAWGFNLKADSSTPTIYNMGSKEAPVAGMNLQVNYQINTILQSFKYSRSYFINGLGAFQALD